MKIYWGPCSALKSSLLILCLAATLSFADNGWVDYQGTWFKFKVRIPAGFHVEKTTPVEDFDIFRFFDGNGTQILGAYAGLHPMFPDGIPESVKLQKGTLGGNPLKYAEWTEKEGLRGEFLVQIYPEGGPVIHFWYLKLTTEEVVKAKEILNTFRPEE